MTDRFRTTRTPVNHCLNCGKKIDAAAPTPDFPDSAPSPGDIALCLDCAHLHVFAEDLTLRAPTDDEMAEIAGDPDMIRAVKAIGAFNKANPR